MAEGIRDPLIRGKPLAQEQDTPPDWPLLFPSGRPMGAGVAAKTRASSPNLKQLALRPAAIPTPSHHLQRLLLLSTTHAPSYQLFAVDLSFQCVLRTFHSFDKPIIVVPSSFFTSSSLSTSPIINPTSSALWSHHTH